MRRCNIGSNSGLKPRAADSGSKEDYARGRTLKAGSGLRL